MPTSRTERIERIQTEIKQLENRRKKLIQQHREQERKTRTRRLIERGALLESLLDGAETLTNEDIKAILTVALKSEAAHETRAFVRKRRDTTAITEPETARGAEA